MKPIQALLALFSCAALPLHAADLDDLTWTTTDGEVTITDCDEAATGELVIPDTIGGNPVTEIGRYAFNICSSLTSITIPENVWSIGYFDEFQGVSFVYSSFSGCTSLTSIIVSEANLSFSSQSGVLFDKAKTVLYVCPRGASGAYVIPDSVTSIGPYAFAGCTSLTSITIGEGVGRMGFFDRSDDRTDYTSSFSGCTSLTSIIVSEDNRSFSSQSGVLFNKAKTILRVCPQGASGAYVIPDSVTTIGDRAFWYCTSLTSITIGDSVTSVEDRFGKPAFFRCPSLTSIIVSEANLSFSSQSGVLFNKAKTILRVCPQGASGAYVIPDSVTSIGDYAFRECTSLTNVTIPDSVTTIGDSAFFECTSLTSITFWGDAPSLVDGTFTDISPDAVIIYPAGAIGYSDPFHGVATQSAYWGITPEQAAAIGTNTAKVGITPEQVAAIETNTAKKGITVEQETLIKSNTLEIGELKTTMEAFSVQLAQLNTQIGDLQGAVAQRDATIELLQGDLATATAERDARFTEDQIRALSADYTIGLNEAGNVQMKINFFESADLQTFAPLTLTPESLSVVDGSICLEFAPADDAAFFRFSVQ